MNKILIDKEKRSSFQLLLLNQKRGNLIIIRGNYPGMYKNNQINNNVVNQGYCIVKNKFEILDSFHQVSSEGLIYFVIVNENIYEIKRKLIDIEDNYIIGRLLDLDVKGINKDVSRSDLGYDKRKCYICNDFAHNCVRSQKHTYLETITYFEKQAFIATLFDNIQYIICDSLNRELNLEYKFGMVSRRDTLSHMDMDYNVFIKSSNTISKYYKSVISNVILNDRVSDIYLNSRIIGQYMEEMMLKSTNNINTHKGFIFLSIVYLTAYMYTLKHDVTIESAIETIYNDILSDFDKNHNTTGYHAYHRHHIMGIRHHIYNQFNVIINLYNEFLTYDNELYASYMTLVNSFIECDDTTFYKRAGYDKLKKMQHLLRTVEFNENNYLEKMKILDDYFIENKYTAGGCADILAIIYMIEKIEKLRRETMTKKIVVASNNEHKVEEIRDFLAEHEIQVLSLNDLKIDVDVEEDQDSFEQNAFKKAMEIYKLVKIPVLSDDSGLEVEALNNEPGIYSARYAGEQKNDQDNIDLLLNNLKEHDNKTARFTCAMCLVINENEYDIVKEHCYGKIISQKRGENGFGYDPIFYVEELNQTFAEIDSSVKNKISHRAKSLEKMSKLIIEKV